MRYFLDTEFDEAPGKLELISIGIVAEDGREYYAISTEFKARRCNQWVKDNVLTQLPPRWVNPMYDSPRLREESRAWKNRGRIREEILAFCDPEKYGRPEFWGWACGFDYVAVTWLMGGMESWPSDWPYYFRDIQQSADERGVELEDQPAGQHDALADARWIRRLWEFLASPDKVV